MVINYLAIFISAILSMIVGAIWYGPLFGKKWLEVVKVSPEDLAKRKEMQRGVSKLYVVQFVLTLLEVYILAYLISNSLSVRGLFFSILVWFGFIVPTLAGTAMWNNDSAKISWTRFLIQGGYQLIIFIIFGLILGLFS